MLKGVRKGFRGRGLARHAAAAGALAAAAFAFRVVPALPHAAASGGILFEDADPWYHMRLVENLVRHFPRPLTYDPYLAYPGGQPVPVAPLFDEVIAGAAWLAGGGSPSPRLVEWVGALAPPAMAAAAVAVAYACGLALWGPIGAFLSGALLAFLPGQFLARSVLGYTDHHVAEVLWSGLVLLFLLRAAGTPDGRRARRAAVWAGLSLAAYLLTWESGIVVVAIAVAWALLRAPLEIRDGAAAPPAAGIAATALAAGLALLVPASIAYPPLRPATAVTACGLAAAAAIRLAVAACRRSRLARLLLPAGAALALAAGAAILARFFPDAWTTLGNDLRRLTPSPESRTVEEAIPFLRSGPGVTPFWRDFSSAGPVAAAGLLLAIRNAWRGSARELLLAIWSATFLALTLAQARFSYYLAFGVALLAAGVAAAVIPRRSSRRAWTALAVLGALLVLAAPGLRESLPQAREESGPSLAWREALAWLRTHSPDPFSMPGYYDALYPDPSTGGARPASASYGVLAWWDYGYWIIRIAHRVPITNPTQNGAREAATLLLEEDGDRAAEDLGRLGVRYVIADGELPMLPLPGTPGAFGKLPALAVWAGQPARRYFEGCLYELRGRWRPIVLFYPDYFRTLAVRLSIFGTEPAEPPESWVVTLLPKEAGASGPRRIEEFRRFPSYREAAAFAAADPARRRVASLSPLETCMPLAPIHGLRLAHASPGAFLRRGGHDLPPVAIYEVVPLTRARGAE